MVPDYHIHTLLCQHAEGELSAFKASGRAQQLPEICFADHMPNPDNYDPRHRMALDDFPAYRNLVRSQQNGEPPPVLFGIEADYYDGCTHFLESWLPHQPLDLVVGSIHYIGTWCFDNPEEQHVWKSADVTSTWRIYFQRLSQLADTRLFDVIGHLDLPKKFGYRPSDKAVKEMAQSPLDRIAAAGMVVEINSSGLRKPVQEIYPSTILLTLARERDIPICFGSDAHKPEEVGYHFKEAMKLAREAGYTQVVRFSQREKTLCPLP